MSALNFPLNRQLLVHLLLVYFSVILLHARELVGWMFIFFLFIGVWRINILREKWRQPTPVLKVVLTLLSMFFVFMEYQQLFALEPMLVMLLFAFSLKMLEIRLKRDYLLLIFLSLFILACGFLFNQSIVHSILSVCVVVLTITALLKVNGQHQKSISSTRSFLLVSKMLVQSVVLMVVLMLMIPRISPFWSVPLRSGAAVTGVSDSMSPGDFNQLIRSQQLAFRVSFERSNDWVTTAVPLLSSRQYWRGLVLDAFDGRRWYRSLAIQNAVPIASSLPNFIKHETPQTIVKPLRYEVILEPTHQQWLIGVPTFVISRSKMPVVYTSNQEVLSKTKIHQRIKYQVSSYDIAPQKTLAPKALNRFTALPENGNPQARRQALQWLSQTNSQREYIDKVLDFYRRHFTYTLSPPRLGRDSVDEFLFQTQQGFCEHYASSFVVLMRNAGIPARVVVGYQGGTWNPQEQFLSVYQRDAHAWAEVWLSDEGWVRIDPTAVVSAIRIEQGLEAALSANERQLLSHGGSRTAFIGQWYQHWQAVNYRWQRWVLDDQSHQQQNQLRRYIITWIVDRLSLFKLTSSQLISIALSLLLLTTLVLVALALNGRLLFNNFRLSREQQCLQRLQRKLHALEQPLQKGETLGHYLTRAEQSLPQYAQQLQQLKVLLEPLLYNPAENINNWKQIKKLIRQL